MSVFDGLTLLGGLCLFLFGMNIMGQSLERRAGSSLQSLLGKLTTGKVAGMLTGLGVTSVIQSSSATTVMVVGFVNSGLMTLRQAINVIMGANIGTTVTAWILSLSGIEGDTMVLQLLKPMSFTPVLALVGVVLYMFGKDSKKKDTGMILLGFATLMYGMDIMTGAVSGLKDVPQFQNMFLAFENPILGVVAGAVLTAIIQSSSASVGILQALVVTGHVTYAAAIPIIMGQNIGTCITAILSSFGTNKNAKRAALVHLSFNVIGTIVWLSVFSIVSAIFDPALFSQSATQAGIATAHSAFNILCTLLLLPSSSLLEKLAFVLVPETQKPDTVAELDERLMVTPAIAIERCRELTVDMAISAKGALQDSLRCLNSYSKDMERAIREKEDKTDHYEDIIATYLVKLSATQISDQDSRDAAKLLKLIGDFERIGDHAVNICESGKELLDKNIVFSPDAAEELDRMRDAVNEILDLTCDAFIREDLPLAHMVEPLEQVIDRLKETLRSNHIKRMQRGECSIEAGFVWADLLNNLERTSDHCSNVAGALLDSAQNHLNLHASLRAVRESDPNYLQTYKNYESKYLINKE